jgi:hypothetical protein
MDTGASSVSSLSCSSPALFNDITFSGIAVFKLLLNSDESRAFCPAFSPRMRKRVMFRYCSHCTVSQNAYHEIPLVIAAKQNNNQTKNTYSDDPVCGKQVCRLDSTQIIQG